MATDFTSRKSPSATQTQDGGTPLEVGLNIIADVAGSNDSLTLPKVDINKVVLVKNTSDLLHVQVFPEAGGTIDDGAADASVLVPANSQVTFVRETDTNWESNINGTGMPTLSGTVVASTTDSQGEQPLTLDWNLVSAADATTNVVTLPEATAGRALIIRNIDADNVLKVYPASGDKIDGGSTNAAVTVTPNTTAEFRAFDSINWFVTAGAFTAISTGVQVITEDGFVTRYVPAADNDASRGAALISAAAAAPTGSQIIVGPGTYGLIAGFTLQPNVQLIGCGRAGTIDLNGNQITLDDGVTIRDCNFLAAHFVGVTVTDVDFLNCSFDGTGMAATTDIINLSGLYSHRIRIDGCTFENGTQDGINITDATYVTIANTFIDTMAGDGISLTDCGENLAVAVESLSCTITNCSIGNCSGHGYIEDACHDNTVSNCLMQYNGLSGIRLVDPIQTVVTGCALEYNGKVTFDIGQLSMDLGQLSVHGVTESTVTINGVAFSQSSTEKHLMRLTGTHNSKYNLMVNSCQFLDASSQLNSAGIVCTDWKTNYGLVAVGNFFTGVGSVSDKGIVLGPTSGNVVTRTVISGNVFEDLSAYALHIYGLQGVLISGNLFNTNVSALYTNVVSGTFQLVGNRFVNSSGAAVDTTGSTATIVARGNVGYADTVSQMGVYISTPIETTISDANYTKAAGTSTVISNSSDMDDNGGTSNRIRYTGTATKTFRVTASATLSIASGTAKNIGCIIHHYDDSAASGADITHSEIRTTAPDTSEVTLSTVATVTLDTNDYVEFHIANKTDTINITADLLVLTVEELIPVN